MQRSQTAVGIVDGLGFGLEILRRPALGTTPATPDGPGEHIDVRTSLNQHVNDVRMVLRDGPHQRRRAAPALHGIDVGAPFDQ